MRSKSEARKALQARYADMPGGVYDSLSALAYANVSQLMAGLLSGAPAPSILLYRVNPRWREVSLTGLADEYPGVSVEFAAVTRGAPLPTRRYDYIFVPLYGYMSDGYRLGHGAGWYDRLLASQPEALRIGVGTRYGLTDFSVESHDIPMDIIVTDEGLLNCRR